MSYDSFMRFLQELLTMIVDQGYQEKEIARNILEQTYYLAKVSQKADRQTLFMMDRALYNFEQLARHADEFACVPGDDIKTEQKRRDMIRSRFASC